MHLLKTLFLKTVLKHINKEYFKNISIYVLLMDE